LHLYGFSLLPSNLSNQPLQIALQCSRAEYRSQSECLQNGFIIIVKLSYPPFWCQKPLPTIVLFSYDFFFCCPLFVVFLITMVVVLLPFYLNIYLWYFCLFFASFTLPLHLIMILIVKLLLLWIQVRFVFFCTCFIWEWNSKK